MRQTQPQAHVKAQPDADGIQGGVRENGLAAAQDPANDHAARLVDGVYLNVVIVIDDVARRRNANRGEGKQEKPEIRQVRQPIGLGAYQAQAHQVLRQHHNQQVGQADEPHKCPHQYPQPYVSFPSRSHHGFSDNPQCGQQSTEKTPAGHCVSDRHPPIGFPVCQPVRPRLPWQSGVQAGGQSGFGSLKRYYSIWPVFFRGLWTAGYFFWYTRT